MPDVSKKIEESFNVSLRDFDKLEKFGVIDNYEVASSDIDLLFNKLDESDVLSKFEVESPLDIDNNDKEEIKINHKPEIDFETFEKIEIRVGKILECKKVEKSKKLLCSKVEIGSEIRQIISGIAKYYSPEEMIGKNVLVVCNLKPITLAGQLSEGMILCATTEDGGCVIVSPEKEIASGSEIS